MSDVAVVKTFLDGFASGDVEEALSMMHNDVVVLEPAGLPMGGEYRGTRGYLTFLERLAATYGVQFHSYRLVDGDLLTLALINTTWTSHATGGKVDMTVCELYTVAEGLITAIDVFPKDTRALYEITIIPE